MTKPCCRNDLSRGFGAADTRAGKGVASGDGLMEEVTAGAAGPLVVAVVVAVTVTVDGELVVALSLPHPDDTNATSTAADVSPLSLRP